MKKNGANGKKRGNGLGTIRRVGKNFQAILTIRDAETGKPKRISRSTGTDDREEARQFLNDLATEFGTKGLIVNIAQPRTKDALKEREKTLDRIKRAENAVEFEKRAIAEEEERQQAAKRADEERQKAEEAKKNSIGLADAFTVYSASERRRKNGERTLSGYETQFERFAKWLSVEYPTVTKIYEVTQTMADRFVKNIAETRSTNTRNKYIVFLRGMWRVLSQEPNALISQNPWLGITLDDAIRDTVRHRDLTVDEIRRLVRKIASDEMEQPLSFLMRPRGDEKYEPYTIDLRTEMIGAVCLAIYTSWRLADVVCCHWHSIDLDAGTMTITPRKTAKRKWTITIPIHPALKARLDVVPYQNRKGYLLPNLAKIYLDRDPSCITNRFQAAFRAALGDEEVTVAPENGTRKRVVCGFHSFRHFTLSTLSNASVLTNSNINAEMVNYIACHSRGSIAQRYYHDNAAALAKAIAVIPVVPEVLPTDCPLEYVDVDFAAVCRLIDRLDEASKKKVIAYIRSK